MQPLQHCGTLPLNTSRLLLRPFVPSDAAALFERFTSDIAAAEALGLVPHTHLTQTKELLREWQECTKNSEFYMWAIVHISSDTCVGLVQLHNIQNDKRCCELGFWVGDAFAKKGYATEAAQAVLDFAFSKIGFVEVCGLHFAGNDGAAKVFTKLGMRRMGLLTRHVLTVSGILKDCVLYSTFA